MWDNLLHSSLKKISTLCETFHVSWVYFVLLIGMNRNNYVLMQAEHNANYSILKLTSFPMLSYLTGIIRLRGIDSAQPHKLSTSRSFNQSQAGHIMRWL